MRNNMQTHDDDDDGERNNNCKRYVIAIRSNLYETEKSNFVYGFLSTCQLTNYFVKSYERPEDKYSLIPPSLDFEQNPKESWQMYDFILQYSMLIIDGFPIRNIFRFFIFWLARLTYTHTRPHSQTISKVYTFFFFCIFVYFNNNISTRKNNNITWTELNISRKPNRHFRYATNQWHIIIYNWYALQLASLSRRPYHVKIFIW